MVQVALGRNWAIAHSSPEGVITAKCCEFATTSPEQVDGRPSHESKAFTSAWISDAEGCNTFTPVPCGSVVEDVSAITVVLVGVGPEGDPGETFRTADGTVGSVGSCRRYFPTGSGGSANETGSSVGAVGLV
jgi:hypothetical protein